MRIHQAHIEYAEPPVWTYQRLLYAVVFFESLVVATGGLYYDRAIMGYLPALRPVIFLPLLIVLYGGGVLLSIYARDLLSDYLSQLNYQERLAYLLIHCLFFFIPAMFLLKFYLSLCLICLNVPFMATLVLPRIYQRVHAVNLSLLCLVLLKNKNASPLWWTACFILMGLAFTLEYYHFRTREELGFKIDRPESNGGGGNVLRETGRVFLRYILPAAVFMLLIYMILPAMEPRMKYRVMPDFSARHRVSLTPAGTVVLRARLIVDAAILAGLIIAAVLIMQWFYKKLRGNKPPVDIPLPKILQRVRRIVAQALFSSAEPEGNSPLEMMIRDYRRLCARLAPVGFSRDSNATPREYSLLFSSAPEDRKQSIQSVTAAFENALYGARPVTGEDAQSFRRKVLALIRSYAAIEEKDEIGSQ